MNILQTIQLSFVMLKTSAQKYFLYIDPYPSVDLSLYLSMVLKLITQYMLQSNCTVFFSFTKTNWYKDLPKLSKFVSTQADLYTILLLLYRIYIVPTVLRRVFLYSCWWIHRRLYNQSVTCDKFSEYKHASIQFIDSVTRITQPNSWYFLTILPTRLHRAWSQNTGILYSIQP